MVVEMWMTRDPITIAPETSISAAAVEMSRRHIRRLLVTENTRKGPRLIGIVSSHDVGRAFPQDLNPFSAEVWEGTLKRPVSAFMTRRVQTTTSETPIEEAALSLRIHKVGALPVLSGPRLVGIITESDIFQAFIEMIGVNTEGIRIAFDIGDDEELISTMMEISKRHGVRLASFFSLHHRDKWSGVERRLGVIRLVGRDSDQLIEEIWKSGHRVLTVLRGNRRMPT